MPNVDKAKPSLTISYTETLTALNLSGGETVAWWHHDAKQAQVWLEKICGLRRNNDFSVKINNEDATDRPPHLRKLGLVYSLPTLWHHLTVTQHLAYGLEQQGIPSYEAEPRIQNTLKDFSLTELADKLPDALNDEEQTRLTLARSYIIEPHCLLLDNPFAHLPEHTRDQLGDLLRALAKRDQQTILLTTNNPRLALRLADRIYYSQDNRPAHSATPADLYKLPHTRALAQATGPINLIKAKIIRADGGLAYVSTPIGEFSGTLPQHNTPPKDGSQAWLAIRPECLKLEDLYPPEENCVTGTITAHTYSGNCATYQLKTKDTTLAITEINPRRLTHTPEREIHAWCDPDDALILTE